MTYTVPKPLTFQDFIAQYGNNPRYELIDGELRDMEPTGPHEAVTGKLSGHLYSAILQAKFNWLIPKNCLIKPAAATATALRPDVIILDADNLPQEPLWQQEPIITLGSTIKLVVEVTSTNWQDDYARKVEEYALLGIPEYWIVDYRGLGGIAFIGKPKQPTFTICQLVQDQYRQHQYHLGETVRSPLFPQLTLRLNDILPR